MTYGRTLLQELIEGDRLTERELDVLKLTAEGLTATQVGVKLHLSSETVRSYRKRIVAKLGARNGVHSVTLAFRHKLIQ